MWGDAVDVGITGLRPSEFDGDASGCFQPHLAEQDAREMSEVTASRCLGQSLLTRAGFCHACWALTHAAPAPPQMREYEGCLEGFTGWVRHHDVARPPGVSRMPSRVGPVRSP